MISLNASVLTIGGAFNVGTFNATGGIGTFSNTASQVNVTGTINNTGNVLTLSNATGSWSLSGGTISGGTLNYADGRQLIPTSSAGTLNNVTISGDLNFATTGARAIISGNTSFATARLRGMNSAIGFAPSSALNGTISFEGFSIGNRYVEMNGASGNVTIAPGSAIITAADFGGVGNIGKAWWFAGDMTLINNGVISSQSSGRTIIVAAASFDNNNLVEASNGGTMNLRSPNSGGILTGGSWKVSNAGTLSIQPGIAGADAALRDAVYALVKSGRNGGSWDGSGIGSTSLPENETLGVILDATVAPAAVLVRHTLVGDLNLDRIVTISDFIDLSSNFGKTNATYADGDTNYDGQVTIADFIDLSANFNASLPAPAPTIAPQAPAAESVSLTSPTTDLLQQNDRETKNHRSVAPDWQHRLHHRRHRSFHRR
jgi:hypothetical protein